ncbi:hypothetical protein C8F01DRAFT_1241900 [Mycena amicta]|nr:hypothetical protein C8F01DRAFT_1241900 [Mycena amicta]
MSYILPPAAKLSLSVRKNVRDEYENRKAEFEKQLSDLLGVSWTYDFDILAVYPYAEKTDSAICKDTPGTVLRLYMEGVITGIQWFVDTYGATGAAELNTLASAHTIFIGVGAPEKIVRSCDSGTSLNNGALTILFHPERFGSNPHWALNEVPLFAAVNAVSVAGGDEKDMTFLARLGISKRYAEKADPAKEKFRQLLGKDITFDPNFTAVFVVLLADAQANPSGTVGSISEWELQFGAYTASYFEGMAFQLESLGFSGDEMLKEGFNDAVGSGVVKFRIVERLKRHKDCEVEIEDGVLYLQTTVDKWGWNPHSIGWDIADLL